MDEKMATVPFVAHESMMTRMERTNHRLWILSIFLIICLIASNVAWVIYESQFEYYDESVITQEVQQHADGDSVNRFIGGDYVSDSDSSDYNN
jgi:hypothetical protein